MPSFVVQLTAKLQRVYEVKPDTVIGRAPQCDIQILSRAVSRRHARIEFDGTQAIISDLGTKNGIKLNGARVDGAAVVSDGDVLVVGDVSMRYRGPQRGAGDVDVVDLRGRAPTDADARAACQPQARFLLSADQASRQQFGAEVARARIQRLPFDADVQLLLQVALKEALDNAARHGVGGDPAGSIGVAFAETDDEFSMAVSDTGPGFDFEAALATVTEVEPLDAIRRRGELGGPLGLRIILGCVDRLGFSADGRTIHMGRLKPGAEVFVISD